VRVVIDQLQTEAFLISYGKFLPLDSHLSDLISGRNLTGTLLFWMPSQSTWALDPIENGLRSIGGNGSYLSSVANVLFLDLIFPKLKKLLMCWTRFMSLQNFLRTTLVLI
jgi:hypothetical protein